MDLFDIEHLGIITTAVTWTVIVLITIYLISAGLERRIGERIDRMQTPTGWQSNNAAANQRRANELNRAAAHNQAIPTLPLPRSNMTENAGTEDVGAKPW